MSCLNENRKEIKETQSLCPECYSAVPATVYETNNQIMLRKVCSIHGTFENQHLLSNPETYHVLNDLHCSRSGSPEGLIIKLTHRCNQECEYCYMRANECNLPDPSQEAIRERVASFTGDVVYLSGGEPTLRGDLFAIVRMIRKMRFKVLLFTNGKKLRNRAYVQSLKRAEISAVILQCDSTSDSDYAKIRNEALFAIKDEVLKNLGDVGLPVMLYVNVVEDINEGQVKDLFDYALARSNVRILFFNPLWNIGRQAKTTSLSSATMLDVVCESLGFQSGYFYDCICLSTYLFELRRRLKLRKGIKQPPCSVSCYVVRSKNGYVLLGSIFNVQKVNGWLKVLDSVVGDDKSGMYNLMRVLTAPSFYALFFHCLFELRLWFFLLSTLWWNMLNPGKFERLYGMFFNVLSVMVGQFPDKHTMDFSLFKGCNMHTEAKDSHLPTCLREVLTDANKL